MNFLRSVKGANYAKVPFQQFSGSSKNTSYTFALNTLSIIGKAPKAAFKLAVLGFGGATTYYSYQAHLGYKNLKKEAKEALSPFSKALEKIGLKEPEVKEDDLTEKTSSVFRSILASDPSLEPPPLETPISGIKELEPLIIKGIETLEKTIAPPAKEGAAPADPLTTEKPPKDIKTTIHSLANIAEARIIYELECKKIKLKKEIDEYNKK